VPDYWQGFSAGEPPRAAYGESYPAPMPDGRSLMLPLRDMGDFAVAGLIANQASFAVLDQLCAWLAPAASVLRPDIVVGLPTLGHFVGSGLARALGHPNWVAPSVTRKRWYDDRLSVPLSSITSPAGGANTGRRMWLDPRMLSRLEGRRVLLADDVVSTGVSAQAGLALLREAGITPVGLAVAMIQGDRWQAAWPAAIPVVSAFQTPSFTRMPGGWAPRSDPHPGPPHEGKGENLLPSPLWGGAGGGARQQ
jgi:adenine/guanine phosphoribosyltransferase-like PRPP-binding protein